MDLLLYDNNVAVSRGDKDLSKKYSRAAQYRINEKDKTVKKFGHLVNNLEKLTSQMLSEVLVG